MNKYEMSSSKEFTLCPAGVPAVVAAVLVGGMIVDSGEPFNVLNFSFIFCGGYLLVSLLCGIGAVVGGQIVENLNKIRNAAIRNILKVLAFFASVNLAGYITYRIFSK